MSTIRSVMPILSVNLLSFFIPGLLAAPANLPIVDPVGQSPGPPEYPGDPYGLPSFAGHEGNPVNRQDSAVVSDYQLVPGQQEDAKVGLYLDLSSVENPQPLRGELGATDPGPRNREYEKLNSDVYAPLGTDKGDFPSLKWPMGLSRNRGGLEDSGFARQQNIDDLPKATEMAGVDMRLEPNAYRELHWHQANEWSYIFNGSCRVGAMDESGQTSYDDLNAGDVWFFPSGKPHTIQALDKGCEFLLVFDQGAFSEEDTFLVTELFLRTPKEVLAKNLKTDISAFDNIPQDQLYIFPGTAPPTDLAEQNITGPGGTVPNPYTFHWSKQEPWQLDGGSIKIIDPNTFPIAYNFSAVLVTIHPGGMREVHWHTNSDEWDFFLQGSARMTVFAGPDLARTFDFAASDVGYVPYPDSHYIENVGDTDVVYLEVLQAPQFSDISMAQWLGLTPPQVVKDTLKLPDALINNLPKYKNYLLPGNRNLTTTNFTQEGPAGTQ